MLKLVDDQEAESPTPGHAEVFGVGEQSDYRGGSIGGSIYETLLLAKCDISGAALVAITEVGNPRFLVSSLWRLKNQVDLRVGNM